MDFSEKLRQIRRQEGLSQEQLAQKIGVSRQAITKWETGKGMPDIENVLIISEIFKMTLDELLKEAGAPEPEAPANISETVYDIAQMTHFDIVLPGARKLTVTAGHDEKLHVQLSSDTLEDIGKLFKVRLDERKNRLDVNCDNKASVSRYEAEDGLNVKIVLPESFTEHCEIQSSVARLEITDLNLHRFEYDGDAAEIIIENSSGSFEFTGKSNYDAYVSNVSGAIDFRTWKARTLVHTSDQGVSLINNGFRSQVNRIKNGRPVECTSDDDGLVLSLSGHFSELDLILQ